MTRSNGFLTCCATLLAFTIGVTFICGCRTVPEQPAEDEKNAVADGWSSLFDGKTMNGWKAADFGGTGDEVSVEEGRLILDYASVDLSGVTWAGSELPDMDYEIRVVAMRMDGTDFFCGLTFPYKDSHCSLIVGGWGGSLIGISSFDDLDASENETTTVMDFENGRWYTVRVKVTENHIQAWIDDKQVVDAQPGERRVSVRVEVEASRPLGVAAWNTKAAIRSIELRNL